jgi:hypothetical protein
MTAERTLRWRGAASIAIQSLHFPCKESREEDSANTERLRNIFRKSSCNPLPLQNHIPAEIDNNLLTEVLAGSGVSEERLHEGYHTDSYPRLEFPAGFRLTCLHGRHRVLAAPSFLAESRWVVDLYTGKAIDQLETASHI